MKADGKTHLGLVVVCEALRGEVVGADFHLGGPRVLRQAEDLKPPESPHTVSRERGKLRGVLTSLESTS